MFSKVAIPVWGILEKPPRVVWHPLMKLMLLIKNSGLIVKIFEAINPAFTCSMNEGEICGIFVNEKIGL